MVSRTPYHTGLMFSAASTGSTTGVVMRMIEIVSRNMPSTKISTITASRKPTCVRPYCVTSSTICAGMRSLVSAWPSSAAAARIRNSIAELRAASIAESQTSRRPRLR